MKITYLTKEGLEKLKSEYEELKSRRPRLVAHLEEARQMGDLRENAEYHSTKEALAKLDKRMYQLGEKLKSARVLDKKQVSPGGKILLGSTVVLKNLATSSEITYQLVDSDEIDVESGKISVVSPIGRGLLNKKAGETAEINVPAGILRLQILKVG